MKPRRRPPPQSPLSTHEATPTGMRALADELDAALPTAPPSPVSTYLRRCAEGWVPYVALEPSEDEPHV